MKAEVPSMIRRWRKTLTPALSASRSLAAIACSFSPKPDQRIAAAKPRIGSSNTRVSQ